MAKYSTILKIEGNQLIFVEHVLSIRFFTYIISLKYDKAPAKDGFYRENGSLRGYITWKSRRRKIQDY